MEISYRYTNLWVQKVQQFFESPRCVLTLGCCIGVFCTLLLLAVNPVYYRDSVVYMSMVSAFKAGDWTHAFNLGMTPLLPLIAGILTKTGIPVPAATMLVSSIFCILTIFPLYGLLSFFMERKYAAWGALLFLLMPKIIRFGMAPLLDSARWLFFSLALYLVFSFVWNRRYLKLVWLGCTSAALCLVRSEGIVYTGTALGVLGLLLLYREKWHVSVKLIGRFSLYCLITLTIVLVLCLPRLIQLERATGYPALDTRQTWAVRGIVHQIGLLTGFEKPVVTSIRPTVVTYRTINDFDFAWAMNPKFESRFWKNMFNGCYPVYLVFSVIGIIVIFRRKEWTFLETLMLLLLAWNAIAFFLMRSSAGRYFFINAIFLMPFTVRGLRFLWEKLAMIPPRFHVEQLAILGLAVATIFQLHNGLDNVWPSQSEYFKVLGGELKQWQGQITPRSGTRRITLLTIGDEYGWGIYADANSFAYASYNIDKTWPLEKIIDSGLPSDLANFVVENLADHKTLLPDAIVIADGKKVDPALIEKIKVLPGVQEFSFPASRLAGNARFFRLDGERKAK